MATGDALSHGCKGMICKRPTKVLCYRQIYIYIHTNILYTHVLRHSERWLRGGVDAALFD